jgi:hypothetical protein
MARRRSGFALKKKDLLPIEWVKIEGEGEKSGSE